MSSLTQQLFNTGYDTL